MTLLINKNVLDSNFNFAFKATTYKNMQIAIQAFEELININKNFFSFEQINLFGRILSYAIEKQFNDSSFSPKSNYSVVRKDVNEYKQKATFIETNDFTMNIGKTMKRTQLLSNARYKQELAKRNKDYDNQYELFFSGNDNVEAKLPKSYGIIAYGYRNKLLTHLELIIPDSTYSHILYQENLLDNYVQYDGFIPKEVEEEGIVKLRKSILKELENQKMA